MSINVPVIEFSAHLDVFWPDPPKGSDVVGSENGQYQILTLLSESESCLKHGVVDLSCCKRLAKDLIYREIFREADSRVLRTFLAVFFHEWHPLWKWIDEGLSIGETTWKSFGQHLLNLNTCIPCDPAIPLLDTYPVEMSTYVHQKTCTKMFIAALFLRTAN